MTTSVNVHDVASVAINRSYLQDCKSATVEIIGFSADGARLLRAITMTLPTPITDANKMPAWGWYEFSLIDTSRQLERDAMTLALHLYDTQPEELTHQVREVMERWRPRVEALLESK